MDRTPPTPLLRLAVPALASVAVAFGALGTPAPAVAQASPEARSSGGHPAAASGGAPSITAADLRRHVGVIADDSMRGRPTPSPELSEVAEYIASRFRAAGLRPGMPDGSYLQRYPVTVVRPDAERPHLRLSGPGGAERLRAGSDFVPAPSGPDTEAKGPLRLWRPEDPSPPEDGVLLVPVTSGSVAGALGSIRGALGGGAGGALVVLDMSSSYFLQLDRYFREEKVSLGEPEVLAKPVAFVRKEALPAGLARALDDGGPVRRWTASLSTSASVRGEEAPNVVGWIRGSDPELRDEVVVFSAHMDHLGVGRPVDGDSIYNGADDDGSGTATLLELAEAFGGAEPPRRSVVFLAVSGEERGLLGSRWYTEHPVFPLERTVADFNMDMIGRNWKDTVAAIGLEASTLGSTAREVAAGHPELGLTLVGDRWPEERLFVRSDHFHFAEKGVPVLFFFSGLHEDYHRPGDEPGRLEYGKTARIGRFLYYLGRRVAEADERPEWDEEAYRALVGSRGDR